MGTGIIPQPTWGRYRKTLSGNHWVTRASEHILRDTLLLEKREGKARDAGRSGDYGQAVQASA